MKNLRLIAVSGLLFLFSSCQPGIQKGQSLSRNHVNYIRSLRLLSGSEYIILFDSQYKIRISGNFFTDKRIAAYWINERDTAKSTVNFAFYKDIDSIKTNYFKTGADVSFLEVYKTGGEKFKVYVKADSAETKYFFDYAVATWKRNHLTVTH